MGTIFLSVPCMSIENTVEVVSLTTSIPGENYSEWTALSRDWESHVYKEELCLWDT